MKLNKIDHRNSKKGKGYWCLILETSIDVIFYFKNIKNKHSKDVSEFWMDAKQNSESKNPITLGHFVGSGNGTKHLAATYIDTIQKGKSISIEKFCSFMDNALLNKFNRIMDYIKSDKPVRINMLGGYCPYEEEDLKVFKSIDCTEEQCIEYLKGNSKFLSPEVIKISGEYLVIENDKVISDEMLLYLQTMGINNKYYLLNNFRDAIYGYKEKQYYEMFNQAIENGLTTIIFETTLNDMNQITQLKNILELVMKSNPYKFLEIRIMTNTKHNIKSGTKNIKIISI